MFREMENLSARLKRSEQMKSNFLSNIRNELNNPIASVLGLSRALLNVERLDARQIERYAFLIHHEVFNLDFQMKNIFAAAEIEASEMKIHPAIVDVRQLLRQLEQTLSFKTIKKRISIQTTFSSSETLFCIDSYMLHLMMHNLLSNAIEFSQEEGIVSVTIGIDERQLKITVKDQGDGIDREDQKRIFERFSQLDEGSMKRHGGHGLGLAIVSEVIEMLSGTLEVCSEKGQGSEFTLTIPVLGVAAFSETTKSEDWNEFLFGNDNVL